MRVSAAAAARCEGAFKMLGNIGGVNRDFHPTDRRRRPAMADLKAKFEQAVTDSKSLPEKPDNMTLLKLYALYKQGTSGDADGKRPGFGDMVGRAKWDAWNGLKGKSNDEAMQEYVDLVESLKE
jgi:acyl-CoA-binding protein